jgi:hypothetical protein
VCHHSATKPACKAVQNACPETAQLAAGLQISERSVQTGLQPEFGDRLRAGLKKKLSDFSQL